MGEGLPIPSLAPPHRMHGAPHPAAEYWVCASPPPDPPVPVPLASALHFGTRSSERLRKCLFLLRRCLPTDCHVYPPPSASVSPSPPPPNPHTAARAVSNWAAASACRVTDRSASSRPGPVLVTLFAGGRGIEEEVGFQVGDRLLA